MTDYGKVSDSLISLLEKELGADLVFFDEDILDAYSRDQTKGLEARPDLVIKPRNVSQIQRVVQIANEKKIPITPRGQGYGLSGGAVPLYGGIVISLERMNKVIDLDLDNLMAVVEQGIITGNFHRLVEEEGLFYPPDPASLDSCSIGGNIAEGAGGPYAVKYGTTKDYVCGLEVVLPSGEIIETGGKVVKDATGYSLTQFFVGSEGTLGIITKAILRLLPLPGKRIDLLVAFDKVEDASRTVSMLLKRRVIPTAVELMDNSALKLGEEYLKEKPPFPDAQAHLLFALNGNDEKSLEEEMETIEQCCDENNAADVLVAKGTASRERLWKFRRCLFEAAGERSLLCRSMDPVVPRAKIPALLAEIKKISEKEGFEASCFGHAGDGNIHITMFPGSLSEEEWLKRYSVFCREIYVKTSELGGRIAAEHGIGAIRKDYLPISIKKAELNLLKEIKKAFDSKNIMNPGKIFDM
ncbi:MAG: FAD-binding protein [Candidatus Schekmanbacteria bacterium]|nr:MAG: FAD-binding protein [Candidatus Schekmanbacteria bacterium]